MASATFTVNGSAVSGAVSVSASSTVTLALTDTDGVSSVAWSMAGNSNPASLSNPTITPAGTPSGVTASFPVPADPDSHGQSYLVQCVVNGGIDANGNTVSAYTFRAVVGTLNGISIVPFPAGETTETDSVGGWTRRLNVALDAAAGGGLSKPTNPGDDGLFAVASGGDLAYGIAGAVQADAIGTAQTPGATLRNTTAATSGVPQQWPPMLVQEGRGWDGAASQIFEAALQAIATNGISVALRTRVGGSGSWTTAYLSPSAIQFYGDAPAALKPLGGTTIGASLDVLGGAATSGSGGALTVRGGDAGGTGSGGDTIVGGSSASGTDQSGSTTALRPGGRTGGGTIGKIAAQTFAGVDISQWFDDGTFCALVGASDGVAHITGGGFLSSSLLVDADVSGSANLSCQKTDGNFGLGTVSAAAFTGVFKATGTVAAAGDVRLGNTALIKWYDGTADRTLIDYNSRLSNGLGLGSASVATRLFSSALDVTDGTRIWPSSMPTLVSTATTTTDATPTALASIAVTDNTTGQIEVRITGRDTTNHKVFRHRAVIDYKKVSGTLTLLETATQKNSTTGVSPAYDGIGVAADVTYSGASGNLIPTFTGKAATTIAVTEEAWITELGAI